MSPHKAEARFIGTILAIAAASCPCPTAEVIDTALRGES